jgi:hypothetical protein
MKRYEVNDKVVFRTNGKNQVGVITNRRVADNKTYYDLRSEAGSGFVLVPVDKARNKWSATYAVIDSKLSEVFNQSVENGECEATNLFAKTGVGHTRGNFSKGTPLWFDGENGGVMGQMEKRNDFIFPTQGPRSF